MLRRTFGMLAVVLAAGSFSVAAEPPSVVESVIPNPPGVAGHSTHELAFAPDGAVWVTQQRQSRLVRLAPDGAITTFDLGAGHAPHGIDFDRDGFMWVTFEATDSIVRVDTRGRIVARFMIPHQAGAPVGPHGLVVARDGGVWWTGKAAGVVGRLDPVSGRFAIHPLARPDSQPIFITEASDGSLWFTELNAGRIGRITPDGGVAEYALPQPGSRPIMIAEAPDRRLWFSLEAAHGFGTIDPDGGNLKLHPVDPADAEPAGIAFDARGHPWIAYRRPDMLGAIRPDMSVVPQCIRAGCAAAPPAVMHRLRRAPDGALWFTELDRDAIGTLRLPPP